MEEHISFVGLDVHRATIAVCLAEAGRDGEVRFAGKIANEPAALDKLAAPALPGWPDAALRL